MLNPEETSVLLPLNEPVDATEKSQVSTFLDYMGEESVQHVAFKVDDVVEEVERMRGEGVEFLDPPPDRYYEKAREVAGGRITDERWEDVMRLGILVDVETSSVGEGMLMQIFTKPFSSGPEGGGCSSRSLRGWGAGERTPWGAVVSGRATSGGCTKGSRGGREWPRSNFKSNVDV